MNKLRIITTILFFFYFFPFFLAAREPSDITTDTFEETAGRGLVIRTNPSGVRVFIDGVERTLTPFTIENLITGEHNITLIKAGYKERRFNVTLFSNSRLVVSIEMEEIRGLAFVSIFKADNSSDLLPFNPQISTNALDEIGEVISLSHDNKTLLSLPAGYHTIISRAFGWEDTAVTVLINEDMTSPVDIFMKQAAFRIGNETQSRRRFNPMNSNNLGINEYRFDVTAPGSGTITVFNKNGTLVHSRQLPQFETWAQSASWNGRDTAGNPLPEGIYTVVIEASPSQNPLEKKQLKMESEINYSLGIFPLSLAGGIPGLIFTPLPDTLPAGSFQIEANLLFGKFILASEKIDEDDVPFTGVPFGIGIRFSPLNNFEASAFFNINPRISFAGWGVTGSLKYKILSVSQFALSAGVTYAWASKYGENPLSSGRGIGIYVPTSMELSIFSIIFNPGIFWKGPEGLTPDLLLGAGVLYQGSWFNTGLSMRTEFGFKENSGVKLFSGVEAHFYPSPSNLVFSAQAGLWTQNSRTGAYGGIGIGIIY
jgi:hypothetical protein